MIPVWQNLESCLSKQRRHTLLSYAKFPKNRQVQNERKLAISITNHFTVTMPSIAEYKAFRSKILPFRSMPCRAACLLLPIFHTAHKNHQVVIRDKGSFSNDKLIWGVMNVMEVILKERQKQFFFEGWAVGMTWRRFGNHRSLEIRPHKSSRFVADQRGCNWQTIPLKQTPDTNQRQV